MAPKALLFSLASLLIGSSHALSNSVNGNANGNCTFDATMAGSCAAKMDGKLPSFVPSNFHFGGNVRRYYIAAEEVEWDYAPTGWDNWLGVPMDVSPRANSADANQFGTKWLKALYRGYTDQSFSQYSEQPPYQGTQGPTIRGEVGDMIEIMFVNKMRENYATMHSMGLDYTKYSEGADYPNTTTPDASNTLSETNAVPPIQAGIAPQGCVVYKWLVSDSAGPNPSQPARTHSYHSYVSLEQDSNAGLIGPTIVYRRGEMAKTMAEYREIPLLYMIYNEANSFLSASNAAALLRNNTRTPTSTQSSTAHFPSGNSSIWLPQIANLNSALNFPSAPSFYTMNGYIFANNPIYDMCLDDKVIWYVNAYGAASHVFHMHGNGVTYLGNSEYAVSINDGVGKTLVMDAVGEGVWQIICHVDNHHAMGMVSNYRVRGGGECKVPHL